jgi:hypothetical protein
VIDVHLKIEFSRKNFELIKHLMTLGFDVVSIGSPAFIKVYKFGITKDGQEKFRLPRALKRYKKEVVAEKGGKLIDIFTNQFDGSIRTVEVEDDDKASIKEYSVIEADRSEEKDSNIATVLIYGRIMWYGGLYETLPPDLVRYFKAMSAARNEAQNNSQFNA